MWRALGLVPLLLLTACASPAETAAKRCNNDIMAFVMSQTFVSRQLKAPSTAKFPYITDSGVSSVSLGECKFKVRAYVDAQNGFGAMIRTRYSADMEYLPDEDAWVGTNVQVSE